MGSVGLTMDTYDDTPRRWGRGQEGSEQLGLSQGFKFSHCQKHSRGHGSHGQFFVNKKVHSLGKTLSTALLKFLITNYNAKAKSSV